jgi:rare lipoprotein A
MDDGPMDSTGINLDAIPDATPAVEPLHRFANRPYNVFGVDYTPQLDLELPFSQTGVGSWYGRKFHGQRTSSGEIYDMFAMTAAHPTLPIPSYVRVSSLKNGRSVIVRVNDRGPFLHSRVIDLSFAAAYRLGYTKEGSSELRVEKLTPQQIAQLGYKVGAVPAVAVTDPSNLVATSNVPASALTGFFLQVGAFSVEDNAKAFLSRLSLEFGEDLPNLQIIRKEPVFRLLAGPYRSRDDAHTASRRLKQSAELAAIVIQQ